MDSKYVNIAAKYLENLEIFPYFNICHYFLVSIYARQLSPGNKVFSRQHPLSSWFASMIMCFAGSVLSNLLIGEPLIVPLKNYENILHASVCWYVVNYFPFDLFYKIGTFPPIFLALSLAKELYRAKMVHVGVAVANKRYPDSILVWLLIGVVKGCAEDILVPLAHAAMGILETKHNVLLYPPFNVKGSLACAALFTLEKLQKLPLSSSQILFAALLFLTYARISSIFIALKDPFVPFENIICGLFFGGLVEYIKSITGNQTHHSEANHSDKFNESNGDRGDGYEEGDVEEEEEEEMEEEEGHEDSELRSRSSGNNDDHDKDK